MRSDRRVVALHACVRSDRRVVALRAARLAAEHTCGRSDRLDSLESDAGGACAAYFAATGESAEGGLALAGAAGGVVAAWHSLAMSAPACLYSVCMAASASTEGSAPSSMVEGSAGRLE